MAELNDHELLRDFACHDSDAAFAALVERYVNLVYATAIRSTANPHQAQEITQAVFVILARKARTLSPRTILSGWLYQTARLTAANFVRGERRRQKREQEAHMQSALNDPDPAWQQIAPLLDEAMGHLSEADRNAVVLRYFENKTASEAAASLRASEAAVHKRVNRAVDKLRAFFTKRGVTLSTAAIIGAVSANSAAAAPAGLAATVATATTQQAILSAITTTLVNETMKTLNWLKIKFAVGLTTAVMVAGGVAVVALSNDATNQPAKAAAAAEPVLIVPGESVGKVRKGMTTNEVIAVLGQPEKWQGKMMVYDKRLGMAVGQTAKGAMVIFCGDSMLKYPGVKTFKGRSKEGIGMESTRAEVIQAFGQPKTAQPWNTGQEQLEYPTQGLTFVLESGKVINILVDFRKP